MYQGLQSPLLTMLLNKHFNLSESTITNDSGRRMKILDVGPAFPETVQFFSQVCCRLYIADLFTERAELSGALPDDEPEEASFPTLESYPEDERFDICLFWDFLNHLDIPELKAFNLALQPFIHGGTTAHAFTTQNSRVATRGLSYGIEGHGRFSERERTTPSLNVHVHALSDFKDYFPCLNITRSRLLTDGRVEILMSAHGS